MGSWLVCWLAGWALDWAVWSAARGVAEMESSRVGMGLSTPAIVQREEREEWEEGEEK